jgi:hypothetical protein
MKHPVLYIIILLAQISIGHSSYGQIIPDTCITTSKLNALKAEVQKLKEANAIHLYNIRLLTELKFIDTLSRSSDSLVLNYIGINNQILKKEKQVFRYGCMTDSTITHYNRRGLIEYIEFWTITCDNPDTLDNEIAIFKYKGNYSRYEYDALDRVSKYVVRISRPLAIRNLYYYSNDGKRNQVSIKISDNEFWD